MAKASSGFKDLINDTTLENSVKLWSFYTLIGRFTSFGSKNLYIIRKSILNTVDIRRYLPWKPSRSNFLLMIHSKQALYNVNVKKCMLISLIHILHLFSVIVFCAYILKWMTTFVDLENVCGFTLETFSARSNNWVYVQWFPRVTLTGLVICWTVTRIPKTSQIHTHKKKKKKYRELLFFFFLLFSREWDAYTMHRVWYFTNQQQEIHVKGVYCL